MVIKIKNSASERPLMMGKLKIESQNLSREINEFVSRNRIGESGAYCPQCLKAHILKKAEELNININFLSEILSNIKSEAGHNGYYLDKNVLIKM